MEITVKRDVKIDSDKVLKLLSSHIESSNKSGVKLLYVNSSLLKDAYDLIKYFEGKEESKEKKEYCIGDLVYFKNDITIDMHNKIYITKDSPYQIISKSEVYGKYRLLSLKNSNIVEISEILLDKCGEIARSVNVDELLVYKSDDILSVKK